MASTKISDLTALAGADSATGDVIPIVDTDAAETKKITVAELASAISLSTPGKNVIINGNFDVWQRGTATFTAVANGEYTTDRWIYGNNTGAVIDVIRATNVPDETSDYSLHVDVTTLDNTIGSGDLSVIGSTLEGYNVAQFGFGTSDAQQLTLSFWVSSGRTGTHCVSFRNSAANRSYVATYTVDAADTWEKKSITLTADTTGTWLTDNGAGLRVLWTLAAGSTLEATAAGAWEAGNFVSVSGQVNLLELDTYNFYLSRVQLELGPAATEFQRRPFAEELALCQRYYWRTTGNGINGTWRAASVCDLAVLFPVTMRAQPTGTLLDTTPTVTEPGVAARVGTSSAYGSNVIWVDGASFWLNGFSSATAQNGAHVTNGGVDLVEYSAEL